MTLTVRRAGKTMTVSIYPRYNKEADRMLIGFDFGATSKPFGAVGAAGSALSEMWHVTTQTLTGFGQALHELEGRQRSLAASSGSPRMRTKRSSPVPASRWSSSASSR